MQDQSQRIEVRASAILTSSYVAGTILTDRQRYSDLILLANFTKGSLNSGEIKVEMADKVYYSLAYDGQSANFTAGKIVTGASSGAKGTIITDTDGGATGTLVIDRINNIDFLDNEAITDDNGTPGAAVVNGTLSVSDYTFYQTTAEVPVAATPDNATSLNTYILLASGKYRIVIPDTDKYVRISAIGNGTATSSLLSIEAISRN